MKKVAKLRVGGMATAIALLTLLAASLGIRLQLAPAAAAATADKTADTEGPNGPSMSPVNSEVNDLQLSDKFQAAFSRIQGGEVAPCRTLEDPYPEFNGIALDPQNGVAVLSDTNLKSALVYDINAGESPSSSAITPYKGWIKGPATYLSFAAGVALDPVRQELYTTENDIGDDVAAFPYSASGNYKSRALAVQHGAYGIALSQKYKQMAVAIQHNAQLIFYRIQAEGAALPVRSIRGMKIGSPIRMASHGTTKTAKSSSPTTATGRAATGMRIMPAAAITIRHRSRSSRPTPREIPRRPG